MLPHHDVVKLILLLPSEMATKVSQILTEQEVKAHQLVSSQYMAFRPDETVESALKTIRSSHAERETITHRTIDDRYFPAAR